MDFPSGVRRLALAAECRVAVLRRRRDQPADAHRHQFPQAHERIEETVLGTPHAAYLTSASGEAPLARAMGQWRSPPATPIHPPVFKSAPCGAGSSCPVFFW